MSVNQNIKKYLKKSDESEDKDLMPKEMRELEEAIEKSKQTAEIEEEQRKSRQEAEKASKSFSPPGSSTTLEDFFEETETEKFLSPKPRRKQSKSPSDNRSSQEEVSPQNDFMTFQDFIEAPESSLDIIYHHPVFHLPIATNPLYKSLPLHWRFNLIFDYFTKLEALRLKTVKKSNRRAPWPKPIYPSDNSPDLKSKSLAEPCSSGIAKLFQHIPDQQVYVSRAGRQVKRKIYTEEIEDDSDTEAQYSANKKNKADDSDIKLTVSEPYTLQARQEVGKSVSKIPRAKLESPKRVTPKKLITRSDELFAKLLENDEKKRLEEVESDNFQRTLPELDEAEEDMLLQEEDSKESSEEYFVKKRVPPPIPIKRGEKTKRPSKEGTEKADSESPPDRIKRYDAVEIRRTTQNKPKAKLKTQKSRDNVTSGPSTSRIQKTPCPICGLEFLQSEIQKHAANCGIEDDIFEEPSGTNRSAVEGMTCELCDRVFLSNADFQIHVKLCIAKTVTDL